MLLKLALLLPYQYRQVKFIYPALTNGLSYRRLTARIKLLNFRLIYGPANV